MRARHSLPALLCALMGVAQAQYTEPYLPDPAFNAGITLEDRFAGADSSDFLAQRIAVLADGDVVVAGLVPAAGHGNVAGGLFNIGLVRYGPNGERRAWANPAPWHSHYGNRYVVFDNDDTQRYTAIRDLKVADGYIHVLADWQNAGAGLGDVHLLVFDDSGAYAGHVVPFGSGFAEYGAALVLNDYLLTLPGGATLSRNAVYAVASYVGGGLRTITTLRRYSRGIDGSLTVDATFGPHGNGAIDLFAPGSACVAGSFCSAEAKAMAATRLGTPEPVLYIAAETRWQGDNTDVVVFAVEGSNGTPHQPFGQGAVVQAFNRGGSLADTPVAIAAESGASRPGIDIDRIYVAASVTQNCARGIGLLVMEQSGALAADFSPFGSKLVRGGSDDPACSATRQHEDPAAMALFADRIAIAGTHTVSSPIFGFSRDPMLAVIDNGAAMENRGGLLELGSFPALRADLGRWGDAGYASLAVVQGGRLALTGTMEDFDQAAPYPRLFGTTRLAIDSSRLPAEVFADGFE